MSKCFVGLGHLVGILFFLHGAAGIVGCVHDFTGQAVFHLFFAPFAGIANQPTDTQCFSAVSSDLYRYLIVGTADTASLNFNCRHNIFQGVFQHLKTAFSGLFFHSA